MTPDEFRARGYEMVDWIADYLETVGERRILPDVEPGDIRAMLPDHAPEDPESFDAILADLDRVVMPGVTHWQSPGWFSYFPANSSPPSILGEMASAGLGVQGMLWSTSPAATELESVVLDWLVDLMGLPSTWKTTNAGGGVINQSASDSNHLMLVVARQRAAHLGPVENMVAYASQQAHSSVERGARIAGYGHVRLVGVDDRYAMDPARLREQVATDREAGLIPVAVTSVIGTTATTAVDPLDAINEIAVAGGMWHHVDAAYAGNAMICPEFRLYLAGVEGADSYTFNPHKWLLTNFDCNILYVADRAALIETLSILPPYLRNEATDSGAVIDYRDWHVSLGRRFRALKLWFVIRSYGAVGLRNLVRGHVALADDLAARLETDPRFELVAPHPFGLVCFRAAAGDEATQRLAEAINASGHAAVTAMQLDDRYIIRVSIGQAYTDRLHVERLWSLIDQHTPAIEEESDE
jgi:aromatic-L-amino-acid decarboxylase